MIKTIETNEIEKDPRTKKLNDSEVPLQLKLDKEDLIRVMHSAINTFISKWNAVYDIDIKIQLGKRFRNIVTSQIDVDVFDFEN